MLKGTHMLTFNISFVRFTLFVHHPFGIDTTTTIWWDLFHILQWLYLFFPLYNSLNPQLYSYIWTFLLHLHVFVIIGLGCMQIETPSSYVNMWPSHISHIFVKFFLNNCLLNHHHSQSVYHNSHTKFANLLYTIK